MEFTIASLPLAAGTLALCPAPAGAAARAALATFAPGLVVSMTGAAERAALGIGDLPEWLAARGIGWRDFPVEDFSTPAEAADWAALAQDARAVLGQGGRVLVHCRGGCGRSGMAVMRLMVEAGEAPDAALARLRSVRPCAVETEAQRLWASAQPGSAPSQSASP